MQFTALCAHVPEGFTEFVEELSDTNTPGESMDEMRRAGRFGRFSMKLTIRDLLWLTLLVASVTMWALEWRRGRRLAAGRLHTVLTSVGREPDAQELQLRANVARFREYSDADLDSHLAELECCGDFERYHAEYEPCLMEMARRKMTAELNERYRTMFAEAAKKLPFEHPYNLPLLSSLRRAEGKADPLAISLSIEDVSGKALDYRPALVRAKIQNVDSGGESLYFVHGANACRPRKMHWKFTLTSEQGERLVPEKAWFGSVSGVFNWEVLTPNQAVSGDYLFDLRAYLVNPKPGRYTLQAYYQPGGWFTGREDVESRIVLKSDPVLVEVQNPGYGVTSARPAAPPPLAVFLACSAMVLTSIRISTGRGVLGLSIGISRRDFRWGMMLLMVGIVMCATLPDTRQYDPNAESFNSEWTVKAVPGV